MRYLRPLNGRPWLQPELRIEIYISIFVFLVAFFLSAAFLSKTGMNGSFYQKYFAPAVMETCGRGFVSIGQSEETEGLYDFLHLKRDSFDCNELPRKFTAGPLNNIQSMSRYLFKGVSLTWQIAGISWSGLLPLFAFLYAVSCVFGYLILRLGANRLFSLLGSAVFITSYWQLQNLPHLRDYSKAPFMLAELLLCAWLVRAETVWDRRIVSILVGLVVGIGLGVRLDILLFLPFVFFTIFWFSAPRWTMGMSRRLLKFVEQALLVKQATQPWPSVQGQG